jgi:hypothetical protein
MYKISSTVTMHNFQNGKPSKFNVLIINIIVKWTNSIIFMHYLVKKWNSPTIYAWNNFLLLINNSRTVFFDNFNLKLRFLRILT